MWNSWAVPLSPCSSGSQAASFMNSTSICFMEPRWLMFSPLYTESTIRPRLHAVVMFTLHIRPQPSVARNLFVSPCSVLRASAFWLCFLFFPLVWMFAEQVGRLFGPLCRVGQRCMGGGDTPCLTNVLSVQLASLNEQRRTNTCTMWGKVPGRGGRSATALLCDANESEQQGSRSDYPLLTCHCD